MAVERTQLLQILNNLLTPQEVLDYCPNGLQVEGKANIEHLVTGVTASQALIDRAIEKQADAILVHHGYFWKGESQAVTGMKKNRLSTLLREDINLFAFHLPIDIHPQFGNNVQLGAVLGISHCKPLETVAPSGILYSGEFNDALTQQDLAARVEKALGRTPLIEGPAHKPIRRVAWCTGGGQGYIEHAALAGMDAFISGEVSEQTIHVAREMGIHYVAAGHHATERYGVKAVGEHLAQTTGLNVSFIDIDNPA